MSTGRIAFVRGVAAAAGLIALVTPFTADVSPIEAMLLAFGIEGDALFLLSVSAPALLAIPIAVWQIRRTFGGAATKPEIALAYLFSIAAMLPVLALSLLTFSASSDVRGPLGISALAVYWSAAIVNVGLLLRNQAKSQPREICTEVFLLLAYVPNALYALLIFSYWGFIFGPSWMWDIGAYVVLTTCVMYISQAFVLIRLGRGASAR